MLTENFINSIMDSINWWFVVIPALAYLHGYLGGRHDGIRKGASQMFDRLWQGGELTERKNERVVTLTNDE